MRFLMAIMVNAHELLAMADVGVRLRANRQFPTPGWEICPLCKSAPIMTMLGHFHWQTSCKCTTGSSRITAGHSARRWVVNCRHAAKLCAAKEKR